MTTPDARALDPGSEARTQSSLVMSEGVGPEFALQLRHVSKTFPGVRALLDVDLDVRRGSVHALVGHNGSGKSTLLKCLAGVYMPDPGSEAIALGEPMVLGDPRQAHQRGLRFVHQDFGIVAELGLADNVGFVAGYERGRFGAIDWGKQARRSAALLARFGFSIDPDRPLAEASPPERTAVAIVRAVANWHVDGGVLVLDEPTAALASNEVDRLFALIREITAGGASVILVSHRLDEVMEVADHVTVLRDGSRVWDGALADVTIGDLVDLITGTHDATPSTPVASPATATADRTTALQLEDLRGEYLRGVDLTVAAGEVVGVAGLLGSGREELPYVVAGDRSLVTSGRITVADVTVDELSIARARQLGIALVPADRLTEGIVDGFTTIENVSLGALARIRTALMVRPSAERRFAREWFGRVRGAREYESRPILTLSGGNQQKAVLARSLAVLPKVLVLSEPTAGVDIGARNVFYEAVRDAAAAGLAVLMSSSDIEDLTACCDRVVALRDGRVVATFEGDRMTKSAIGYAIEGAHDEQD